MNRLTRAEACEYIGCSIAKLSCMERQGTMEGTYYQIGRRRLYITERLKQWMLDGGEQRMIERMESELASKVVGWR